MLTGSFIQSVPGRGKVRKDFTGLESASPTLGQPGLAVTLASRQLGSVRLGSPVFYRGIEVCSVTATDLAPDATAAQIKAFIPQRYARLFGWAPRFWLVGGVDVNLGLFGASRSTSSRCARWWPAASRSPPRRTRAARR